MQKIEVHATYTLWLNIGPLTQPVSFLRIISPCTLHSVPTSAMFLQAKLVRVPEQVGKEGLQRARGRPNSPGDG